MSEQAKLLSANFGFGNGASMELIFSDEPKVGGRQCGSCSLCCKLLPVRTLRKPANQKCRHSRHQATGCCKVYDDARRMPPECGQWSCRWLADQACDVSRPDRVHYVIDVLPDYCEVKDPDQDEWIRIPLVQVWVDPAFPDAHEDPRLRRWLEALARETGQIALIRLNERDGFVLIPPSMSSTGKWFKQSRNFTPHVGMWNKAPFPP